MEKALQQAYTKTAKQLFLATFAFILTSPCLFLTQLVIFNQVALLLMLSLFLALIADMLLLPAIFCVTQKNMIAD